MLLSVMLQINITSRQFQNEEIDVGRLLKSEEPGESNLIDAGTLLESEERGESNLTPKLYATLEELEKGRLPPEEILSLPKFKVIELIYWVKVNSHCAVCTLTKN